MTARVKSNDGFGRPYTSDLAGRAGGYAVFVRTRRGNPARAQRCKRARIYAVIRIDVPQGNTAQQSCGEQNEG